MSVGLSAEVAAVAALVSPAAEAVDFVAVAVVGVIAVATAAAAVLDFVAGPDLHWHTVSIIPCEEVICHQQESVWLVC